MIPLQEIPSRAALSREGYSLVESDRPEEILDGAFFLTQVSQFLTENEIAKDLLF
jgi:hypothetical protein